MQLPMGHEGTVIGTIVIIHRQVQFEVVNKFGGEVWIFIVVSQASWWLRQISSFGCQ